MANEFIIKNGFRSQGNSEITGSISTFATSSTATVLNLGASGSTSTTLTYTNQVPTLALTSNTNGPSSGGTGPDYLITLNKVGSDGGPKVGIKISNASVDSAILAYRAGAPNYLDMGFLIANNQILTLTSAQYVGIGTTSPSSKLHVKGAGTTSGTTALLVQNSNNSASLQVYDDNTTVVTGTDNSSIFTVGWGKSNTLKLGSNTANSPQISLGSLTLTAHPGGSTLAIDPGSLTTTGTGTNTNRPISILPQVTGTSTGNIILLSSGARIGASRHTPTSGVLNMVAIGDAPANQYMDFAPSSGNATFNSLFIRQQINTSGSYSGIVRGIFYEPLLTSTTGVIHRAIETVTGDVIFGSTSGNVGIGTPTPSASLHISGSSGSALFEIDSPAVNNILFVSGSGRVGIGTGTPIETLDISGSARIQTYLSVGVLGTDGYIYLNRASTGGNVGGIRAQGGGSEIGGGNFLDRILCGNGSGLLFHTWTGSGNGSSQRMQIFGTTGNILIQNGGTFTDAGFRLDVNGTARTTGQHTVGTLGFTGGGSTITSIGNSYINFYTRGFRGFDLYNGNATAEAQKVLIGNFATFGVETSRYTAAMLVIESTTKGFLPPRTSTTSNISSPGQGLITYVVTSSLEGLYYYNSGSYEGWTRTLNNSGSQSITGGSLTINKSGSTVLDIQGSQGQLFSVVDALSGSLMSVNDVSGLPILEVFSDDRVVMGTYGAPALIVTGSNTVISGSLRGRVVTLSTASATASMDCSLSNFFDLTLSGSMYLGVSNIQPGETINLRITQPTTSGSLNYTSSIKFPNGLPYSASATSSVVDLISFISFDSSTLYATSLKNLI
jgi:hypothetical protein